MGRIIKNLKYVLLGACFALSGQLMPKEGAGVEKIKDLGDKLVFTGRILLDDKGASWDWAGSQVAFNVDSASITFVLEDGKNDYNVLVDGEPVHILETKEGQLEYQVELPGKGEREVILAKRNDPNYESGTLRAIGLAKGGQWFAPPQRPDRRIEFIGDSYTVGYGNEGPGIECKELRPFENNWWSFSSVASRELEAEGHMIAISGFGVVRNYGDKEPLSKNPVPYYYDRVLKGKRDSKWDFSSWQPHAVVIKLGTNDTSTDPKPSQADFKAGYHALLERVKGHYGPEIPLFLVVDSKEALVRGWIEQIHEEQKEKGAKSTFVLFSDIQENEWGCNWHPTVSAHKRFAQELITAMRPVMGWEEAQDEGQSSQDENEDGWELPPIAPLDDDGGGE